MMRALRLIFFALGVAPMGLAAQLAPLRADGNGIEALRTPITVSFDTTVAGSLTTIAQMAGLNLTFDPRLPGLDDRVTLALRAQPAAVALLAVIGDRPLAIGVSTSGQLVVTGSERRSVPVVHGLVLDAAGEPIADVHVDVVEARATTATREDGRYALRAIPQGQYTLRFSRLGYVPVSSRVQIDEGNIELNEVTLRAAAIPLAAVLVSPGQFGIMEQTTGVRQTLTREEIQTNPQLGEDIFRAINRLPGLSANDMSAKFHVRGGAAEELYTTLDGVVLYEPFHLKDIDAALSLIDVEAIGGVDLNTGGFAAEYGDRLTGVLSMRSIEPRREARSAVGLSVTNLRAMSQGSFGGGKGGWLASARRGYLDLALRLANADDSLSPRYYDLFGKVQYDLTPDHRVAAHVLRGGDRLLYASTGDPTIESAYGSTYGWLTWNGSWSRLHGSAVASLADLSWRRRGSQFDDSGTLILDVHDTRSAMIAALRQDWSFSLADWALLRFGANARSGSADMDYRNWMLRFGSGNGQMVSEEVSVSARANPSGPAFAAYVSQRVRFSTATAELGVRYDEQHYGVRESQVSPRASASWSPTRATTLRAAWGKYYQPQEVFELQVMDGDTTFYPAQLAVHRVAEVEQRLPGGMALRGDVYERRLSRSRPRYVNYINGIEVFPELSGDRVRLEPSGGRARGWEMLLTGSPRRRATWSASYANAEVVDFVGGRAIPRAVDQRHTVYLDGAYRARSGKWLLSAGWSYHSGWPYTPTYFRMDTVINNGQQLSLNITSRSGELNSGRLAAYRRLDLRATRYFETSRGRISTFIDLFNALNAPNPRGYEYDLAANPYRITRAPDSQVPRLPSFGVTWEF